MKSQACRKSHTVKSNPQRSSNHPPEKAQAGTSKTQEAAVTPPPHLVEGDCWLAFGRWGHSGEKGRDQPFKSFPSVHPQYTQPSSLLCSFILVVLFTATHTTGKQEYYRAEFSI